MKKISKILSILLAIVIIMQVSITALATTKTSCIFNDSTYTHQSKFDKYKITQGIDVSEHNGTVDFTKVKKAGVDFVILRLGWIGNNNNHTLDKKFETYYKACKSAGIPIGVYVYSYCESVTTVKSGAQWVMEKLKGKTFDYPIYLDMEDAQIEDLSKTTLTNITTAFCEELKNAGYNKLGVYANKYWLTEKLDTSKFSDYSIWLANYITTTNYAGDYDIWQFSESGTIDGIDGKVDCNFMYTNPSEDNDVEFMSPQFEVSEISNQTYTGSPIKPAFTVKYKGSELIKGEDYTVSFKNNTNIGDATITIKGCNDYSYVNDHTITFKIVPQKTENLKLKTRDVNAIKISWDKISNAEGYQVQVYRSTGWVTAGTTTSTSYNVSGLTSSSNYSFRVRAYKTINGTKYYGSYSKSFVSATNPAKVTNFEVSARGTNYITLTWKKQSGASKYRVYKYNSKTEKYEFYKDVTTNSCKITDLKANSTYKFKVKAYKNAKEGVTLTGENSSAYTAYTKPEVAKIKSAKSSSTKKIAIKWNKVASVTGYQVMWSTTKDFSSNYKSEYVSGASTVSKTVTTAQSNKKYYVRVRSYKTRDGKKIYSSWSETLSVKTK